MDIKEQLEQWIEIKSAKYSDVDKPNSVREEMRKDYTAGTNEMKELLLIAVDALQEYASSTCYYANNDIAIDAIKEIQEKIKGE